MTSPEEFGGPGAPKIGSVRRVRVSLSEEHLVRTSLLGSDRPLPLVVQPAISGVGLLAWAENHREFIANKLAEHGGMLFRDFGIKRVDEFERLITITSDGELMTYSYKSTPRSVVSGKIYTSTEYPADQSIPLHNEMSYSRTWPMKAWFYCVRPAALGGQTPIADSRRVYESIDPDIRDRFMRKKVQYVRNYGEGMDLRWQDVFQTTDRAEVEEFCRQAGIQLQWKNGDRLRTRQLCQSVARHPRTGQMVWFNQAHLFHISSLEAPVGRMLLEEFGEQDVPRNAFYGDGSPIEVTHLEAIRSVYQGQSVCFEWQEGDVLMLDNMLVAHGRTPFEGTRRILVGLAEPLSSSGV